jgi:hypothetical protein
MYKQYKKEQSKEQYKVQGVETNRKWQQKKQSQQHIKSRNRPQKLKVLHTLKQQNEKTPKAKEDYTASKHTNTKPHISK